MIRKMIASALLLAASVGGAHADFKCSLGGRLFVDAGFFPGAPETFHTSVGIPDLRLAGKVYFGDGFYGKLDIGFAKNLVSMKDVFIQKSWDKHLVRTGYTLGYYSIDQSSSTNDYIYLTGSNVAETFYPGRHLGVSYNYMLRHFYVSVGAFCGDGLNFSAETEPGFNSSLRVVSRPIHEDGHVLHLGTGGVYRRPDLNKETGKRPITLASKGATYLSVGNVLSLTIPDAQSQTQCNVEALYQHGKWMGQAEYKQMFIKQANGNAFHAQGAYAQVGYLIRGSRYEYDYTDAVPVRPSDPHSLLITTRVNCTDLNDTELKGGRQWDTTLGVNYYYNTNLCVKLNYSHIWADEHTEVGNTTINMIQARIQLAF